MDPNIRIYVVNEPINSIISKLTSWIAVIVAVILLFLVLNPYLFNNKQLFDHDEESVNVQFTQKNI